MQVAAELFCAGMHNKGEWFFFNGGIAVYYTMYCVLLIVWCAIKASFEDIIKDVLLIKLLWYFVATDAGPPKLLVITQK